MLSSYLLGEIHLLGIKLVELVLRAASRVLLLVDLQVSYLGLLHHMLEQHLLVKMTCYVGFVRDVDFFLTSATSLKNLVSARIKTLH